MSPVDWEKWEIVPTVTDSSVVGLTAIVDTSSGAFTTVPTYQVRVEGLRPLEIPPPGIPEGGGTLVLDVPAFVSDSDREQFRCWLPVVSLGGLIDSEAGDRLVTVAKQLWDVVWMGVGP
jgi:hypothetical protein